MNWFLIALGAPFLWAIVNISDQYLVSKYSTEERGSGGLVLFSSLIGLIASLVIWFLFDGIWSIPVFDKLLLMITGLMTIVWVILYLFSLELEDVSKIVPWFLTVPIFGYLLGYVFLGETLTRNQQIGSLITILGLLLISINFNTYKKNPFNKKVSIYMLISCLLLASIGIIFKYVTVENNFWVSSFWQYIGLGTTGLLLFIFMPKYRKEFMHMNRMGGVKIFSLNIFSEFITIIGNLLTNYALLLAPVTVVYLVGSFQPAIVLLITILGTLFFPNIVKEDLSKNVILPKTIAIIIMIIGSALLF